MNKHFQIVSTILLELVPDSSICNKWIELMIQAEQSKYEGFDSWDQPCRFSGHATLQFDSGPWKNTTDNLFRDSGSYACHFIVIHEFKLKLSPGSAQIRAKSATFRWNETYDPEKQ